MIAEKRKRLLNIWNCNNEYISFGKEGVCFFKRTKRGLFSKANNNEKKIVIMLIKGEIKEIISDKNPRIPWIQPIL